MAIINYSVCFFGHRDFDKHYLFEADITKIIENALKQNEVTEFLVGRNGEFDQFVSSVIRRVKKEKGSQGIYHVLVLPYATSEYINNQEAFEKYYDDIEICEKAASSHYKAAIQIRNKEMIDRSELVVCYVERNSGGAYYALEYARKRNKQIIILNDRD